MKTVEIEEDLYYKIKEISEHDNVPFDVVLNKLLNYSLTNKKIEKKRFITPETKTLKDFYNHLKNIKRNECTSTKEYIKDIVGKNQDLREENIVIISLSIDNYRKPTLENYTQYDHLIKFESFIIPNEKYNTSTLISPIYQPNVEIYVYYILFSDIMKLASKTHV